MKRGLLPLALFLAVNSYAQEARRSRSFDQPPTPQHHVSSHEVLDTIGFPVVKAHACTLSSISCDDVKRGTLEAGDCTTTKGEFVDFYEFMGTKDQLIAASVRPTSPTFTNPVITIVPPQGDASKTPITVNGPAGTVWYALTSTGRWSLGVGTANLFASGSYIVDTYCEQLPPVTSESACIEQELLCGQSQGWSLTSQSCRYNSRPDLLYQEHAVYGVTGDLLTISLVSDDFRPLFGIYDSEGQLLQSSAVTNRTATLSYRVPSTGFYYITATAQDDRAVGFYSLTLNCSSSGCLAPTITREPNDVRVKASGATAIVTLTTHFIGPSPTYEWFEVSGDFPRQVATTTIPYWETGAITSETVFRVRASSPCGSKDSRDVRITVPSTRRHAVRH